MNKASNKSSLKRHSKVCINKYDNRGVASNYLAYHIVCITLKCATPLFGLYINLKNVIHGVCHSLIGHVTFPLR